MCLIVLDTGKEVCTQNEYGFDENKNDNGYTIGGEFLTFYLPTPNVRKIAIMFRGDEPAQIADLKIHYIESESNNS